jgi:hypothetical protein
VVTREILAAVSKVKTRIRTLVAEKDAADKSTELQAATAGRAALQLDTVSFDSSGEESEEEVDDGGDGCQPDCGRAKAAHATRRRKRLPQASNQVQSVTMHGANFKVVFTKRQFFIEARAEAVRAFVMQLRVEMIALALRHARARIALSERAPATSMEGNPPLSAGPSASAASSKNSAPAGAAPRRHTTRGASS